MEDVKSSTTLSSATAVLEEEGYQMYLGARMSVDGCAQSSGNDAH